MNFFQTPGLNGFSHRCSWIELPLATTTLRSLQALPRPLKTIQIEYPCDITTTILCLAFDPYSPADTAPNDLATPKNLENHRLYGLQDVLGFSNLEELTINKMFDNLLVWRRQLATVLSKSPRLRKLELSLDTNTMQIGREVHPDYDFKGFFDNLCDQYADLGGAPLPLKSLRCGPILFPTTERPLQKLVDLSGLEELQIRNEYVGNLVFNDEINLEPPLTFIFSHCPNLRWFSATLADSVILPVLCGMKPDVARQLAVSFGYQEARSEMAQLLRKTDTFPNVPLAFRMTHLELRRDGYDVNDNRWISSASEILELLVKCNADTLEGLAVHVTPVSWDGTDSEEVGALKQVVARLPKLTQLAVILSSFLENGGRISTSCGRQERMDLGESLAKQLSAAAPHLRYVGVDDRFWSVSRAASEEDAEDEISMELLDWREKESVELFSHLKLDEFIGD